MQIRRRLVQTGAYSVSKQSEGDELSILHPQLSIFILSFENFFLINYEFYFIYIYNFVSVV